ncbi:MAG: hypothetical protein LBJ74_06050 [Heliobacteriaceae bacterium]|jgi:hypothetical protein|nr:hypothetical protein [Heliobacteriaceae bacterium]
MGLITATIRLGYLSQSALDLEYKIQLITQTMMTLSQSNSDLMQVGTDYDPDSPVSKMLAQRMAKLKVLEQKLEAQKAQYMIRLKMIETEKQGCLEMLNKRIESTFRYSF